MGRLQRLVAVLCVLFGGSCTRHDAPRFDAFGPAPESEAKHAVAIVQPSGLGEVDLASKDAQGRPAGIACATCHEPGASGSALAERDGAAGTMHEALEWRHGELACASCHASDAPGTLTLASGERIPMAEAMRLCAQCHGPQYRDYQHGAHGGMKGYWDLRRGPRTRNSCLACHGAHAPAYPRVLPAPPPIDRFLEPKDDPGAAYEQRWGEGSEP